MKILDLLTGVTSYSCEAKTDHAKIGVKITGVGMTTPQIDAITIKGTLISKSGQVITLPEQPLRDYHEICSMEEGYFIESPTEFKGTIDIGAGGAASFDATTYMKYEFKGLQTTMSIQVNTIDAPKEVNEVIKYDILPITGSTELNVTNVNSMAFKVSLIKEINLDFGTRNITIDADELDFIGNDINDLITVSGKTGTPKFGFLNWLPLDVRSAVKCKYTPLNGTQHNVYITKTLTL